MVLFMGLQVIQEQLVLAECQSTDWALKLPAVDLLVAPQSSRSGEGFSADVAVIWFHSCVTPHVCLHVLECLPTDFTLPTDAVPGFLVRFEMVS